jgi:hypothetical protein
MDLSENVTKFLQRFDGFLAQRLADWLGNEVFLRSWGLVHNNRWTIFLATFRAWCCGKFDCLDQNLMNPANYL